MYQWVSMLKKTKLLIFRNSFFFWVLGPISLGRLVVPTSKIVRNLPRTYENLHCKGELYRFSCDIDLPVQTDTDPLTFKQGLSWNLLQLGSFSFWACSVWYQSTIYFYGHLNLTYFVYYFYCYILNFCFPFVLYLLFFFTKV